jgi:hypothetical protein
MNPYRIPAPPPRLPPLPPPRHRRTDALDLLFWAIVTTLGLAVASGRGSTRAPHEASLEAN